VSEEHERQWKIMRDYSEPFQLGDPDQTISRQSMTDLTISERSGCITFLKTYSQLVNPFYGFAKREILRFVKGDSRMFICRDTKDKDSITNAVAVVNELSPRVIKLWEEDKDLKEAIVSSTPYFWVDTIVVASGNMVGVYTLDISLQPPPPKDMICVACLPFKIDISQGFLDLVSKFESSMVSHFHSSNDEKKSWKGLALKGYTPSHRDLYKPEEMDKTWQREHSISGTQCYEADLQFTDLMVHFKYYLAQLKKTIRGKFHRIQILSLAPGGTITRHSDKPIQSDLDKSKLMKRFHIPLMTNDNVKFRVWSLHGEVIEMKMEVGFLYLLDNRKPHEVVNEGKTIRYHLVFDVEPDAALNSIFDRSFQISAPLQDFEEKFRVWNESTEFTTISFEETEEDKSNFEDEERIEIEAKKREEESKAMMKKEDDEIMDVDETKKVTTHHSENLFSPTKKEMDVDDESDSSGTLDENELGSNTNPNESNASNLSFSVSDKFVEISNDSHSDDDEQDNSNYKLGKRASFKNNPDEKHHNKKEKVEVKAIEGSNHMAVDSNILVTIDSDKEEEKEKEKTTGDGFIAGNLEEFLQYYDLTQYEESFRKNHLKVNAFSLISLQDLNDMGFQEADLEKWKKFNPTL
jgi:hypothetical protein